MLIHFICSFISICTNKKKLIYTQTKCDFSFFSFTVLLCDGTVFVLYINIIYKPTRYTTVYCIYEGVLCTVCTYFIVDPNSLHNLFKESFFLTIYDTETLYT